MDTKEGERCLPEDEVSRTKKQLHHRSRAGGRQKQDMPFWIEHLALACKVLVEVFPEAELQPMRIRRRLGERLVITQPDWPPPTWHKLLYDILPLAYPHQHGGRRPGSGSLHEFMYTSLLPWRLRRLTCHAT